MTGERVTFPPPAVTFHRENVTRTLRCASRENGPPPYPSVTFSRHIHKQTRVQPIGVVYCNPAENVTHGARETLETTTSTTKTPGDIPTRECHPEEGMSPLEVIA